MGLGLSYASIGLLVAALPDIGNGRGRGWFQGAMAGLLYSVPGAIFTMVPYPLRDDAPRYWHEFAAGGGRAFLLTLAFGAVVGATCGLARKSLYCHASRAGFQAACARSPDNSSRSRSAGDWRLKRRRNSPVVVHTVRAFSAAVRQSTSPRCCRR